MPAAQFHAASLLQVCTKEVKGTEKGSTCTDRQTGSTHATPDMAPRLHPPTQPTHPKRQRQQQAALLGRWADLPLEERTAARNYVATLLLAASPDRYPGFVRSQILQASCWWSVFILV